MADLSTTFSRWRAVEHSVVDKVKKLSPCETYIALLKGYVAISLLTMPKAFANGGYIFAPLCETFAAILTTYSVTKLVDVGLKLGSYSYSGVV
jgi:amino acid permease